MFDQRRFPRRWSLKGAEVNGFQTSYLNCDVRDISDTGARLRLRNDHLLPKQIEVEINATRSVRRAWVRWQSGHDAGIEFMDARS